MTQPSRSLAVRIAGEVFRVMAKLMYRWSEDTYYTRLDTLYDLARRSEGEWKECLGDAPGRISFVGIKLKPLDEGGVSADDARKILEDSIPEIEIIPYPQSPGRWAINVLALITAARVFAWLLWPGMMLCVAAVFARFRSVKPRGSMGMEMLKGAIMALIGSGLGLAIAYGLYFPIRDWLYDQYWNSLASVDSYTAPILFKSETLFQADFIPPAIYIPLLAVTLAVAAVIISSLRPGGTERE